MARKTKKQGDAEDIACGFLIVVVIIGAIIYYWYISLPIVVGIIVVVMAVRYITKKNKKGTPPYEIRHKIHKKDYENMKVKQFFGKTASIPRDTKPYWMLHEDYNQMCKELNKTSFTAQECIDWKDKAIIKEREADLCPNCKEELKNPYKCDLCGWEAETCVHEDGKIRLKENCIRCSQSKPKKEEEQRSRRISQQVKREVWRRDKGRCADCGSRVNLEYDHIVPFSKGGSNTARNIELLCEKCNRSKHNKI